MTKRYWFPRFVRDLVDVDYLDKLSPEHRSYMQKFLDEFYNADGTGISSRAQIREADRAKKRARRDLYNYGLRADGDQLAHLASETGCDDADFKRPEVLAIMEELRVLRPGFDDADGRRRARFKSPAAERRFYELRTQLSVLLEKENA